MFGHILLAVDGSEHARRAAGVAAELAGLARASEIRIVVAFDPIPTFLGEPNLSQVIATRTHEAGQILEAARVQVAGAGGNVVGEVLEGPPAEAILNAASARQTDLIVMGSRGLGRLQGALLGSNSQKVVSHAPCPVLIVR